MQRRFKFGLWSYKSWVKWETLFCLFVVLKNQRIMNFQLECILRVYPESLSRYSGFLRFPWTTWCKPVGEIGCTCCCGLQWWAGRANAKEPVIFREREWVFFFFLFEKKCKNLFWLRCFLVYWADSRCRNWCLCLCRDGSLWMWGCQTGSLLLCDFKGADANNSGFVLISAEVAEVRC